MIKGVYTYEIPLSVTQGIDGVRLYPITENRQSYAHFSNAEEIFVLIARQGAVNDMLNYFPHVRWLQLLNAGYEKVDLELLRKRDILFTNARSFVDKMISGEEFYVTLREAANVTLAILAIMESAQTGKPVKTDLIEQ